MYNPPFFNPYGNFSPNINNYIPNQQNTPQSAFQPSIQGNVLKVSGINGVNALNLAPNTSVLALDETAPILWFVSTDSAGYKTPTPYDITPHKEAEEAKTDLEQRVKRLEDIINEQSNIKQNGNAKRAKSSDDSTD